MKKNIRKCETKIKKRVDEDNKEELTNEVTNEEQVDEEIIEDTIVTDSEEEPLIDQSVEAIDKTIDEEITDKVDEEVVEEPIIEEEELRVDQTIENQDQEGDPAGAKGNMGSVGDAGTPTEQSENIIEGYAIVFNSMSEDLGGFREMILPESVTEELINKSDIYYLFNHNDDSIPLARSNKGEGSLSLNIDATGLYFSFVCLDQNIYNSIKRGDINKASFAFSLPADGSGEKWEKSQEYNYIRKITKIDLLHDLSCVLTPAYQEASVYARSIPNKEVDSKYYAEYDNIINSLIQ